MLSLRSICHVCSRIISYRAANYATRIKYDENEDILKNLGFTEENLSPKAKQILLSKKPEMLKETLELILASGFSHKAISSRPSAVARGACIFEHRLKSLEEAGVRRKMINLELISKFTDDFCRKSVMKLKSKALIEKHINVTDNILSHSDMPKHLYPAPPDETLAFCDVQSVAIRAFFKWRLNLSEEKVDKMFNYYPLTKYKSLRIMQKNYQVLLNDVGMSDRVIAANGYLLCHHPSLFYQVLHGLPSMRNLPAKEILCLNPRLFIRPLDVMLEILDIFKEYNIDKDKDYFEPQLLTLSPKTIRQRLQSMYEDPNFRPYFSLNRFPQLVLRYTEAQLRTKFFTEHDQNHRSLHLLTMSQNNFENRLKCTSDFISGQDIVVGLAKQLKMKRKIVREKLKQNPFYNLVPLTTVWETLEYLTNKGFEEQHIVDALPIVLYQKESVEKKLEELDKKEDIDQFRDPSTGKILPEKRLQLLLYFLEQPFQFSGHGIWGCQKPHKEIHLLIELYLQNCKKVKSKKQGQRKGFS